ncbi:MULTISPECIES: hypothetical protein [Streptomycetaceae]|uniref:Uncharacterized protein n=1 Tax=Streptantibioticus cattleyicolor (strain ATCC 35852 / DSM 46488 / JCM 4925 / NBRC 14057 / NRRL 8057) TaxID=1003195 RepID=F8K0I5_STREN|nr:MULTISPECIES: hypothetical protein [Streptomycetaceae]AEW97388.1 hypothetical protein SCATT_50170 [Streptantibioticus cattleyicolor NRRL 8057 = DSM 46488]MYS61835.1 hypothetical protein [Streptomyces sp. SID5468]CCB77713.1 conserved protein of unknown function [Streptantibioticus cattleyicolor NRRL 8057 = DSM 46488]
MTDHAPARPERHQRYLRVHQDQHPGLVAYARTLTGSPWVAPDVVAEAHFRLWQDPPADEAAQELPALLTRQVHDLAVAADPEPDRRWSYSDLLVAVLHRLPRRWVTALWLTQVEQASTAVVARRLRTGRGAATALAGRAFDGARTAFLMAQPGTPWDRSCAPHWERIPECVTAGDQASAPARGTLLHTEGCADCRSRLAAVGRAAERFPALLGPALLALLLGGTAEWLTPLIGAVEADRRLGPVGRVLARAPRRMRSTPVAAGTAGVACLAGVGLGLGLTLPGSAGGTQHVSDPNAGSHAGVHAPADPSPSARPAAPQDARTSGPLPSGSGHTSPSPSHVTVPAAPARPGAGTPGGTHTPAPAPDPATHAPAATPKGTPAPSTPTPRTQPSTPQPSSPAPATSAPASPAPSSPQPSSPAPATSAPASPAPSSPQPSSPAPSSPAPATPTPSGAATSPSPADSGSTTTAPATTPASGSPSQPAASGSPSSPGGSTAPAGSSTPSTPATGTERPAS